MTIGSFRDATDFKDLLPQPVKEILFGNVETLSTEFDLNEKLVNLNHAAFGLPYKVLVELASHLRSLADQDSALFYDKLICPLIRYSLTTAKEFFGSPHVVFTPNLTIGMKNLLESLLSHDESRRTIAILEPIYGATRKLVHNFLPNKRYRDLKVMSIKPGLFIEDSNEIIGALEAQFCQEAFSYLIADHVTSQSGRILPLDDIIVWCKEKSVILIVDGTQSAELKLPQYPPYYILSTHKWLCNLRTCGVLRIEPGFTVPEPAGISFGYGEDETSEHLWTGMQDYIPQVTLSVALRIYEKHGKNILQRSSNLLQTEVNKIGVPVVLPYAKNTMRMINLVKVNRFDNVAFERLQDALDMRDLRVSVKNFENQEYLRISVFSYTTEKDFKALSEVLNYKLNYQSLTKEKLMQEFLTICAAYETLFDPLEEDGFFVRAEPLRHHLIFYYGHTSVFYINKLVLRGYLQNSERLDRLVESSCAVGVDEMSWDDLNEDNYPWTEESQRKIFVPKIRNYGEKVRELICKLIGNFDFSKKKKLDQLDMPWLILMGIEHCRIHIETSACIIHQLQPKYLNLSNVSKQFSLCPHRRKNPTDVPSNILVPVCGGSVQLGRSDSDRPNIFGWDNEFGNEEATLQDFEVSQMIVSNAEFLEFINDGGYTTREYWTDESWSWVTGMKRTAPLSWRNNNTMLRTLYEEIPMPWDWPVEVNSYEADAFCLWKSKQLNRNIRLISHEEWFLLRTRLQGNNYNINMKHWGSACPVDMFGEPANNKADILYDITGNVWQHSCSVLTLLQKGFKTHPAYDDFTTPTIDGKHYFLLGGSWISCGNPSTIHARYGFRKHFQQFAGIRYVASSNEYHSTIQPYYMGREDCLPITDQYLEFTNETFLEEKPKPNWYRWFGEFAASCVESENSNALDVIMINGSVGRTTLEFIRACKNSSKGLSSVMHTDLTATRLRVLESLNKCGMIRWDRFVEGDLVENLYFSLEENNLIIPEDIAISFRQLDTNNIDPKFCNRDVAVVDGDASNFTSIDRITPALVKPGGILVLASIAEVKQIPGYEFLKSDSAWKISSDTIRKYRVVKLHVSAWRRTEVSVGDIPAAADVPVSGRDENVYYESLGVVQSYEKFHFGPGYLGVPNFSKAVAEFAIKVSQECKISLHRALDVGSGPGRTAIELAQVFEDVTAIDFSASFIEMCKNNAPAYPLPQGHQLHAVVGDAHGLITEEKYDLVVAINLIDRLSEPKIFLDGIKPLLADNGLLIVASPFTWLEEFTSKSKWLGGYQKWGETHKSIDGLKEILSPEFKLIGEPQDIPFVIPDPDGSFQYCLSNTSVFSRV